ncbi:YheC/YheD family protein [Brevibacillus fulvus]|uniref:Glutathione synthase/RimK-type ligase-like ATP-grasp enzyme n=1 Tax=Brevibacillus fulvus TaxID=1125967 RepID=A0A939BQ70_9BACL|nr:YheC/YheD family protein [Brevibacillus fulvus]MBM7591300.1 glutathione synthase/RimK-type ligase-like ATP-grasp enzyme [Brevibacillus fulvus]
MSYVRAMIQAIKVDQAEADLYLPRNLIRKWQLPAAISVQFGNKVIKADVKETKAMQSIRANSRLVRSLHLPLGNSLQLRYAADQHRLVFGPLIGILLSSIQPHNQDAPFGPFTPFLNEIAEICRKRGMVACAFCTEHVDWEKQTLRGLVQLDGTWRMTTLPLPQCIYNRLTSRRAERTDQVGAWIQRCKEFRIPFFNEQFLNKWNVHKALEHDARASDYLPKTIIYQTAKDLADMLTQHRLVYAKPTSGSMGRGIFRIQRTAGGYSLTKATDQGSVTKNFKKLDNLHQYLVQRKKGKVYLLQQGLRLIGFRRKPVDFRVLVQRNRRGEWAVTSLIARLGQNSVVSNIARGGSMLPALQALRLCGPWQTMNRPDTQTLKKVALQIARSLESSLEGHYAEFGIDLGVDIYGRIWLLEVNSKPSKSISAVQMTVDTVEAPRRPRPSVFRTLDYAAYLCGFPLKSGRRSTEKRTTNLKRR